ncbi:SUMF1/EgtB/PvdO family nonheme iron enzyme [Haloferula sp.]|uniref:SUMF1/EgtB/PvdO family nonheme iron enzyme n=1 Tax=Haloferula sp. TaxID=2497595 RepID=UPI0032A0918A
MPTTKPRPDPIIPDHEVLKRFGGGAYGEVWLARGVTGALRAVKVLWREDFDDERSFEREFEGILKYEPISRDHPGLVNILHVGRSPEGNEFYYYVMELGDDITAGRDINPVEYEARTLRSDIKRAEGKRLETEACIDVGLRLSEGLKHLHDNGLAHRDVKPANVIFVNGKAKLADIGLVAARGQRTFVGTEGFVPPEGPGSAQADVYSLGKVLYEMATGRDRMDFPELPDELPTGQDRKKWLALNQVICEVCEPHVSRRSISKAGELADALGKLKSGKRRRKRRPIGAIMTSMILGSFLAWVGWQVASESSWGKVIMGSPEPPLPVERQQAYIRVTSTPEDAEVLDVSEDYEFGKSIGNTPTDVLPVYVGEELRLRIVQEGYQPYEMEVVVPPGAAEEPFVIRAELKIFAPPTLNEPWSDHLGREYRPLGEDHESVKQVTEPAWKEYVESAQRPEGIAQILEVEESGRKQKLVLTSAGEAASYCRWLVRRGVESGYLTEDYEALPHFTEKFRNKRINQKARKEGWRPFRVLVRGIPYGAILVSTEPAGAEIYFDGEICGFADGPLLIDDVRPGTGTLVASLEGYKSETRQITLGPKERQEMVLTLEQDTSVILDRPWENSLGMKFVPMGDEWLGDEWMAAVWETRRKDFRAYAESVGTAMPLVADGVESDDLEDPNADHPVTFISRDEAEAFCEWLTAKERGEDRLKRSLVYRLPTDAEWSALAGRQEDEGVSPARRDLFKPGDFLWGSSWPPPAEVGNLAGEESVLSLGSQILGYDDGFETTSPVGSFPANELGIYDLVGNAQEWVVDSYSTLSLPDGEGVLRGGGWLSHEAKDLYIGTRNPQPATASEGTYGFRIVIAREEIDEDAEEELEEDNSNEDKPNEDDGTNED